MLLYKNEEFIEGNLGLVHICCKRFVNRGAEYDDLFQAGCMGLIKAARDFDENRGYAFSTYAVPVILGEIKRIFRDNGQIKVSRSLKETALKISALREKLEKETGGAVTVSKLSEISGVDANEITEALNAMRPVFSLTYDDDGTACEYDLPTEHSEENMYNKILVSEILSELSPQERKIIVLRHIVGLTQSEVAKKLSLTQVQISRKERKIIEKINKNYQSEN